MGILSCAKEAGLPRWRPGCASLRKSSLARQWLMSETPSQDGNRTGPHQHLFTNSRCCRELWRRHPCRHLCRHPCRHPCIPPCRRLGHSLEPVTSLASLVCKLPTCFTVSIDDFLASDFTLCVHHAVCTYLNNHLHFSSKS